MEHEVFISYSTDDKVVADAICHVLEHHGITCWIAPRDVRPGSPYAREIISGIKGCKVMILVFTSHSNSSQHVGNEVDMAFNHKKTIIPFLVEDTPMNEELKYYLSRKHWLTAYPNYEERFEELLVAVCNVLGRKAIAIDKKNDEVKNEITSNMIYFKILSNLECRVLIDCEEVGIAKANTLFKIPLKPGDYYVQYVSVENESDVISSDYSLFHDTVEKVDLLEVKLKRLSALNDVLSSIEKDKEEFVKKDDIEGNSIGHSSEIVMFAQKDGTIMAYNLDNSERVFSYSIKSNSTLNCIAFSHDGKWIAYATEENKIVILEAFTGKMKYTLLGHSDKINKIQFNPNGNELISVSDDGTIRIWDIDLGLHKDIINAGLGKLIYVTYSRTSKYFAVVPSLSKKVIIYDAISLEIIQTIKIKAGWLGDIEQVSFSYDEQNIIARNSDKLYMINIISGSLLFSKKVSFLNVIKNISVSMGGKEIFFTSYNEIYALQTSSNQYPIRKICALGYGDNNDITSLINNKCKNFIVSGSSKGYANVIDILSGKVLNTYYLGESSIADIAIVDVK